MADLIVTPTVEPLVPNANANLTAFASAAQGNVSALARFIVDNNPTPVLNVLSANNIPYNSNADAAVIIANLLVSTNASDMAIVKQLAAIPYNNDATNGTGGLYAPVGSTGTFDLADDLICGASKIFGLSLGCPTTGTTTTDAAALAAANAATAAAQAQAASAKTTTYIVIGFGLVIIIILAGLYFSSQKKKEKAATAAA